LTENWQTETLFHTYSQFAAVPNIPLNPTEEEKQTESKLQEILEKVYKSSFSALNTSNYL
jgi:Golgi SNAP receptor complex protein 1